MVHQRNYHFPATLSAPNAKGEHFDSGNSLFLDKRQKFIAGIILNIVGSLICRKGSKSGASMKCPGCQGSGVKISIRHLGPSMIQQMQHACNECKGTGETINDRDRCLQCKGEKAVQEKKVLEVHVEKGMQNGQKITFPGEADEAVLISLLIYQFLCSDVF